ncbi:Hydroxymethylpyrimidine ABC transporter,transmembrane component [Klebsiella pneumoniae IS22]|nr:Hydroxymethylpyrimidine ABC transporter,transmembrane component [Klebsiella pneumoniae IS22]
MTGRLWRGGMVFGGLMLLWGLASRSGIPHFLLPSPLAVAEALWVNRAYLGWHTLITLSEILSGLALGVTLGVTLALGMILSPRLQRWLMPLVLTSQAIPVFALAPLLVLWLGFGMSAKVAMAVLVIFFPVTSAFFDGLRRVNQEYLDLARSMNASFGAQLRHVRLMAALPALGSGLRMAAAVAPLARSSANGSLRRGAGLRHAQRQRATANRYLLRRAVYFSTTDPPAVAGGRYPATPADRLVAGIRMT